MKTAIPLPDKQLTEFCDRWHVTELALFGSILRDDFTPESDIDFLITFAPDTAWGLLDRAKMQQELITLFGRDVDLISKRAIERSSNWIRRQEILSTAQVIYAKQ